MIKTLCAAALMAALSGCASTSLGTVGDIKGGPTLHHGTVKGNYSRLARCVTGKMQTDSRWQINLLQYNVQVYPDNRTSEIQAYTSGPGVTLYAAILTMAQDGKDSIVAEVKGAKFEGGAAWDSLQACAAS